MVALCLAAALAVPPVPQEAPQPRPSFVLVLADDQGWTGTSVPMDRSVPGSRSDYYRTPNLERLAREGMRFSNGYSAAPNCSPSRASIQTGKSPARLGMTDIIGVRKGSARYRAFYEGLPLRPPLPADGLDEEHVTIAEILRDAGYATGHFGKWHLAGGGPGRHGYDDHDGARGSEGRQPPDDPKDVFGVTERACAFIAEQAAAGQPFFVQVSHFAVHLPIRARAGTVRRCEAREPGERHRHARHAAMTEDLDAGLGILLDRIAALGIEDRCYVVYTSDNGAYTHNGVTDNLPLAKGKASVWEGGVRVPFVVRGPGVARDAQCDVPVVGHDLLPTVCALAGIDAPLPEDLDGGSFAGLLGGGRGAVTRPGDGVLWHFPHYQTQKGTTPQAAIRLGDDKLIEELESGGLHLHDLATDLGETVNLAARRPARAAELRARLHARLEALDAPMPVPAAPQREQERRPNVLLVVADDMGWSDPGCYGGEIATPTIDRLAAEGVRFTDFHDNGRCCPTRASLLTGQWSHRAGVGHMTFDHGAAAYRGELARDAPTLAERLRKIGYRTGMVGKWHLSRTPVPDDCASWVSHRLELERPFADPASYPVARGFDEHWGTIWGVVDFFDPFSLVRGTEPVESVPDGFYYTDAINDEAAAMAERLAAAGEPWFLYVAHTAPHWPLHAPEADIAPYEEVYAPGWDAVRAARWQRQLELGLLDGERASLPPRARPERRWEEVEDPRWEARAMAVHAAMIERMDRGLGRLLRRIEELGQLDDTLVLFLSDNGASPERPGGPGFDRPSHTRDGAEVRYPGRARTGPLPGAQEVWAGIGPEWANVANTPFRRWKRETHEGGTRTPLVARWPAGIRREPGTLVRAPGHVVDVVATCLDAAGAWVPAAVDGDSLLPLLGGEEAAGERALFWEHEGHRAVRVGHWKLVARAGEPWELYDLARDATETEDLADAEAERAAALAARWRAWAERCGVLPWAGGAPAVGARQRRFELRHGDALARHEAPPVRGAALSVEAEVESAGDGVVVAHGGAVDGWALFVVGGQPAFATRHGDGLTVVRAERALPPGTRKLSAHLGVDGGIVLEVDGAAVARGAAPSALTAHPIDGLQVGRDESSPVGPYEPPFPFEGRVAGVTVTVGTGGER